MSIESLIFSVLRELYFWLENSLFHFFQFPLSFIEYWLDNLKHIGPLYFIHILRIDTTFYRENSLFQEIKDIRIDREDFIEHADEEFLKYCLSFEKKWFSLDEVIELMDFRDRSREMLPECGIDIPFFRISHISLEEIERRE